MTQSREREHRCKRECKLDVVSPLNGVFVSYGVAPYLVDCQTFRQRHVLNTTNTKDGTSSGASQVPVVPICVGVVQGVGVRVLKVQVWSALWVYFLLGVDNTNRNPSCKRFSHLFSPLPARRPGCPFLFHRNTVFLLGAFVVATPHLSGLHLELNPPR